METETSTFIKHIFPSFKLDQEEEMVTFKFCKSNFQLPQVLLVSQLDLTALQIICLF